MQRVLLYKDLDGWYVHYLLFYPVDVCFVNNVNLFITQWLALDKEAKKLSVETTANQVNILILTTKSYWF